MTETENQDFKVNYNLKTGDLVHLETGMGGEGDFFVRDSYPDGVKLMFGKKSIYYSYEELSIMNAHFTTLKFPDLEYIECALNCYIDEPKDAKDVLVELYSRCGKCLKEAKYENDLKTYNEWLPLYQKISGIVASL